MSREFLTRMLEGKAMASVRIGVRDHQLDYRFSDVG
jgi:type VI secretion system protein VasG